jgi:hypothetical protein
MQELVTEFAGIPVEIARNSGEFRYEGNGVRIKAPDLPPVFSSS